MCLKQALKLETIALLKKINFVNLRNGKHFFKHSFFPFPIFIKSFLKVKIFVCGTGNAGKGNWDIKQCYDLLTNKETL
jgi:hypothetical protein